MYRLLIVDDEELIVNGMEEFLAAQAGLELDVYKAYSGMEALNWLDRTRMDVVLTDIRMPEMDGLQLLSEIRRRWPQCRVIFLTGHSEFEYVYRAIQDPYASYVLKNEDPMRVVQAVGDAIRSIQREVRTEDLIREAKNQLNQTNVVYQRDFFISLLHSVRPVTQPLLEELGAPLQAGQKVLLALCRAEGQTDNYMENIRRLQSVRQLIVQYITVRLSGVILLYGEDQLALFLQGRVLQGIGGERGEPGEPLVRFLMGTLENIQGVCRAALGCPVSFAVASEPCAWADVPNGYAELNQMLAFPGYGGIEELLVVDGRDERLHNADAVTPPLPEDRTLRETLGRKNLTEMEQRLMAGQAEPFFAILQDYLKPLYTIASKNDPLAREAYFTVALAMLSYINRWDLMEKVSFRVAQYKLTRPDLFDSWSEAAEYLRDLAGVLLTLRGEEQVKRADKTVAYLQGFILEHLGEDLSLIRLSEQVNLNPSYLSRLYRQATGINVSDFIERERVALAKKLLKGGSERIQDVAARIGYDNTTSFSRFFKKNTGRSPQEYRDGKK